jgi:hypothetical protein
VAGRAVQITGNLVAAALHQELALLAVDIHVLWGIDRAMYLSNGCPGT